MFVYIPQWITLIPDEKSMRIGIRKHVKNVEKMFERDRKMKTEQICQPFRLQRLSSYF